MIILIAVIFIAISYNWEFVNKLLNINWLLAGVFSQTEYTKDILKVAEEKIKYYKKVKIKLMILK